MIIYPDTTLAIVLLLATIAIGVIAAYALIRLAITTSRQG